MRRLHWRPRPPALPNLVALSGLRFSRATVVLVALVVVAPLAAVSWPGGANALNAASSALARSDLTLGLGGPGGIGFGCRRGHDGRRPWLLGGGVERRGLQLRRCLVLRIGGRADPRSPDRRHGGHARWSRVLAGRFRWRRVQLRRRLVLRVHRARCISTRRSWGWRPRPMVTGTGWSPPTVACSASATPRSTDPRGRCISTRRSWGWPPHRVVAGTGWSLPTVACSASATPRSTGPPVGCT